MTRPAIIINELDAERIDRLLEQPAFANSPVADALNEELDRAQMLAPEAMPHDVVTMNSRVKFRDLTSGEERVRTACVRRNEDRPFRWRPFCCRCFSRRRELAFLPDGHGGGLPGGLE